MADSPSRRYAPSPPWEENVRSRLRLRSKSRSRSRSWSRPGARSRSRSGSRSRNRNGAINPGNTLYVTGLSTRVAERDLQDHFSKEGKVKSVFLVVEPRSRVSRGFAFITMDTAEDANRCIKHLDQSVLEGRYITVERSRRKRGRTPTPGHYLGLKSTRGFRGDHVMSSSRDDYGYRRSPRDSPYRGGRDYLPRRSPYRSGRDYSPRRSPHRSGRDYTPRHSPYRSDVITHLGDNYPGHLPPGRISRRDSPRHSLKRNYDQETR